MDKMKMLSMGSTTIYQNSNGAGIPQLCEQGDNIGQTQKI